MPMEALAVNKLVEEAHFRSDVAMAIADAMDITIRAHSFVTMPVLETRLAASDAKMVVRFAALEKSIHSVQQSIAAAKVWAVTLYAALLILLFSALAADHNWLVSREDELQVRTDQHFERIDAHLQQADGRLDRVEARLDRVDEHLERLDVQLKEIRDLLTAPQRRRSHGVPVPSLNGTAAR